MVGATLAVALALIPGKANPCMVGATLAVALALKLLRQTRGRPGTKSSTSGTWSPWQ
jgi:hypothetical protein